MTIKRFIVTHGPIVLLTIFALLLRAVHIGREPLWGDEALTFVIANSPLEWLFFGAVDPSGPAYYLLHKLVVPVDAGNVSARIPSLLLGTFLIPLVYSFTQVFTRNNVASLYTAVLVSLSPGLIIYSQEARAYALLVFLIWAAIVALAKSMYCVSSLKRRLWLGIFISCALLAVYTHLIGSILVAFITATLIFAPQRCFGNIGKEERVITRLLLIVGASIELFRLVIYTRLGSDFSILDQKDPIGAATIFAQNAWGYGGGLAVIGLFIGIFFYLSFGIRDALRSSPPLLVGLVTITALLPIILYLVGFLKPVLMARTLLPAVPAFAILITIVLWRFRKMVRYALAIILLIIPASFLYANGTGRPKPNYEAAANVIRSYNPELIISCPVWQTPALLAELLENPPIVLRYSDGYWVVPVRKEGGNWHRNYFKNLWGPLRGRRIWWRKLPIEKEVRTLRVSRIAFLDVGCNGRADHYYTILFKNWKRIKSWRGAIRTQSGASEKAKGDLKVVLYEASEPREFKVTYTNLRFDP